jgi:hypothetical protein
MTARPAFAVLLSVAGLVVWAGHFTAIYAATAIACERGMAERALLGVPLVPALVALATLLALALLGLVLRRAMTVLAAPLLEGGKGEPRFTRWLAASNAALAALAIALQALPALLLPGCG